MEGVVIAEKQFFKKALFGHISNGKGIVDLGNGKGIKFVCNNSDYVTLQLIETGIGKPIKTQLWQKTVKVKVPTESKSKPKKPVEKIETKDVTKQSDLF